MMSTFVRIFRQCALTLGQLCDSKVVLGILQNHCQDALWYRVPRDAPSNVDLGAYMFRQTDEFRVSGGGRRRQVATTVSISLLYLVSVFFIVTGTLFKLIVFNSWIAIRL